MVLRGIILFFVFLACAGCSRQEKPWEDLLKRQWYVTTIVTEDGEAFDVREEGFYFQFLIKDGEPVFYEFFGDKRISGKWSLTDSTLIHSVVPRGVESEIDSVANTIDFAGKHRVIFFNRKVELAVLEDGKLTPASTEQTFQITLLTEEILVIEHTSSGRIFELVPAAKKAASSFSFASVFRGLIGIAVLLVLAYLLSSDRKGIDWKLVGKGLVLQVILAIFILKMPGVDSVVEIISGVFVKVIGFSNSAMKALFSQLGFKDIQLPSWIFLLTLLPALILFSALTSVLYYWGILQKITRAFAWLSGRFMNLSGAEGMAVTGNIFLGQMQSILLIRPYLSGFTKSELMCLMTGGMATVTGSFLVIYIAILGGSDPVEQAYFAKHLLVAAVISAPAAIVVSKMMVPQREAYHQDVSVAREKIGANTLEAIVDGTGKGLRVAVNVGAALLVFVGLIVLVNYILGDILGEWFGMNQSIAEHTPYSRLSLQMILGYLFTPLVYLLGVASEDIILVGELLGQKMALNEWMAFPSLSDMKATGKLSEKSVIIATYMLCGVSGFVSVGMQIGGIGSLVPEKRRMATQLGMKALIAATIASLFTATIAGTLISI